MTTELVEVRAYYCCGCCTRDETVGAPNCRQCKGKGRLLHTIKVPKQYAKLFNPALQEESSK